MCARGASSGSWVSATAPWPEGLTAWGPEALPLVGHGETASWCSGSPASPAASVCAKPGMSLRLEGQMGSWQSLSSRG